MKMNQRLKLGILSTSLIVGIVAVLVVLNILIGKWNVSWDMTPKGIYTVSEQTKSIVGGLEQDVQLYILDSEEGFPLDYKQIIRQYEKCSNHIQVMYRDLSVYPNFAAEYTDETEINMDSIIVVCGDKHVYLDSADFTDFVINEDYTAYDMSYELEGLLTSAINTVNDGVTSTIYQTSGHNEYTLSGDVQTRLMRDNYSVADLTLLNEEIPEDADIVLINAPTNDFSEEECQKLRNYLNQGGNLYYILEAELYLDNLEKLVNEYGIEVVEGIVLEQDTSMIYGAGTEMSTPSYIIPNIEDTEITHDLYEAGMAMIVPVAKGITVKSKSGYTVTGLLSTSNYAYSKVNLYSEYVSREDDDILGPFYLAALSEKEDGGKMIVLSSSNVLATEVDEVVSGNNSDFFLNGLNYLLGDTDKISIRSKAISINYNVYTGTQVYVISGIAIIGIPALLIILGIIILVIRKKRSQNMKQKESMEEPEEVKEPEETEEPEDELESSEKQQAAKEEENVTEDTE